MIEKFSKEDIEIIKQELGLSTKRQGSKKDVFQKQYERIGEMFPLTCQERVHHMRPQHDIWDALNVICCYGTRNYVKKGAPRYDGITQLVRYSSVFPVVENDYGKMMTEILNVLEKYRKKEVKINE